MPFLRTLRRHLSNVMRPSIFPELGAKSLARMLPQASPNMSIEMWEFYVELAMRYHYNHIFRLTLSKVFRVRSNRGVSEFKTVGDLGAPPPAAVSTIGRLNEKGQSRFYAADNPLAAILEMRPKEDETLTLTMFGLRNYSSATRKTAMVAGMSKYSSPDSEKEIGSIPNKYELFKSIVDDFDRFILVDNWLAELITAEVVPDEPWKYHPTIALGNMILNNVGTINPMGGVAPRADAILYPSIVTKLNSMNICMERSVADDVFVPEIAWTFQYCGSEVSGETPTTTIKVLRQAKSIWPNNELIWEKADVIAAQETLAPRFKKGSKLVLV